MGYRVFDCPIARGGRAPHIAIGLAGSIPGRRPAQMPRLQGQAYEIEVGATKRLVDRALSTLVTAFATDRPKEAAYGEAFEPFGDLPTGPRSDRSFLGFEFAKLETVFGERPIGVQATDSSGSLAVFQIFSLLFQVRTGF